MDIRKPKSVHSLRAFAAEIGTITIGILIALGFEAGLEAWRHHRLVEHARYDFRQEIVENRQTLVRAIAGQRRVAAGLDQVATYLKVRLAGGTPAVPDADLMLVAPTMQTAAWESAVATQALSHMAYDDARAVSLAYSGSRTLNGLQGDLIRPLAELSTDFIEAPDRMDAPQLRRAQHDVVLSRNYVATSVATATKLVKTYDEALARLR